ncbi:PAS domain S-box protein [Calditrichota bacterium]
MNKINILYIEDDSSQREEFVSEACSYGYNITSAPSGEEALLKFDPQQTDIILCDLNMSGMSGLEVLKKVKQISSNIPFLVITAHGSVPEAVRAIKEGAYDFITKPTKFELIINTINQAVKSKRLKKELEDSQKNLRLITENIPDVIFSLSPEGIFRSLSPAVETILEYKPEELIGKSVFSIMHADDVDSIKSAVEESIENGDRDVKSIEFRMYTKQGEIKYIEVKRKLVFDGKKVISSDGVARDITDRKRLEQEIVQNAKRLEAIFDSTHNVIIMVNPDDVITGANPAIEDFFGICPDELKSRKLEDFQSRIQGCFENKAHWEIFIDQLQNHELTSKDKFDPIKFINTEIKLTNPVERFINVIRNAVFDASGTEIGRLIIIEDVTPMKKSTQMLRTLVDSSPIPSLVSRVKDGTVLFANDPLADLLGVNPDDVIGKKTPDYYVDPDERENVIKRLQHDGFLRDYETLLLKSNGEKIWVIFNLVISELAGDPVIIGAFWNIDERRKSEEALRKSEERLKLYHQIFLASSDGIGIADPQGKTIEKNPQLEKFDKHNMDLNDQKKMVDALEKEGQFRGEVQYSNDSNDESFVDLSVFPIKSINGEVQNWIGIGKDVTQNKLDRETLAVKFRYEEGLAECSQALLNTGDLEEVIKKSLEHLKTAADVGHIFIFENFTDETGELKCISKFEVKDELIDHDQPNNSFDTPKCISFKDGFQKLKETLANNLPFEINITDLTKEERLSFESLGFRSLLVFPIIVNNAWYGCIGFNDKTLNRSWNEEEILLLRTASEMIGGFLSRRKAMEALNISEDRFRSLVENANDVIYSVNPDGRFTYLSPKFEDFSGYKVDDFIGKPITKLLEKDDIPILREWLASVTAGDVKHSGYEFRMRGNHGSIRWIVTEASVLRNESGEVSELIGVAHDITDMKGVLDDLAQANQHLRETQGQLVQSEKMASLGMLVAGIAHEINTPIGAISSMHNTLMLATDKLKVAMQSLCSDEFNENNKLSKLFSTVDEANKVINQGTERVTTIVKRLRSFARLDEAELKDGDVHLGLEDTLSLIHHQIKNDIIVHRNFGDVPVIALYPGKLNQVFLNILINARQAIKEKGEITITTYHKSGKVYIEFQDTGIGIPRDKLAKIFDPGFTTKGVGVGTGLGLSICYQIMQDHYGEIKVESELNKGTTFTLIVPDNLEVKLENT